MDATVPERGLHAAFIAGVGLRRRGGVGGREHRRAALDGRPAKAARDAGIDAGLRTDPVEQAGVPTRLGVRQAAILRGAAGVGGCRRGDRHRQVDEVGVKQQVGALGVPRHPHAAGDGQRIGHLIARLAEPRPGRVDVVQQDEVVRVGRGAQHVAGQEEAALVELGIVALVEIDATKLPLDAAAVGAGEAQLLRPLVEVAQPPLRLAAPDRAVIGGGAAEIRRRAAVRIAAAVPRRMLPRGDRG